MKQVIAVMLTLCTLAFSASVHAHYPTLGCKIDEVDNKLLNCVAGYSDGSLAGEVELKVFSYEEELLFSVTSSSDGSAIVKQPEGEYYIVFNPGHESPAEFDYAELE